MQTARSLKEYRQELDEALSQSFQRKALDSFATAYREGRAKAFAELDLPGLIQQIGASKDSAMADLDNLYASFKARAEEAGATVHLASTAREANAIIAGIASDNGCHTVVKAKSMTAEETLLNDFLEKEGLSVTETDLGEWIIQLRHEGPSHMVMPAIHLSRDEVQRLFTTVTGQEQERNIESLVKVARRELRQRFAQADMGVSGANFAIAESGTLGLVTNEGNARLVTTLPRVHVALVGLDKLVPSLNEALTTLKGLTRNATGQAISSYITWITGANECASGPEGTKNLHIVFLDNGRSTLAKDPVFKEALRCVRCGACANVCPLYRLVGGHKYGHIYIGAIGLILTYFFHGLDKDKNLVQNCLNCQACRQVCVAGIDLPRLIKETQALVQQSDRRPVMNTMASTLLTNRRLFHGLLQTARYFQKPLTGRTAYLRHLPHFFLGPQDFKALPALAPKPFRSMWEQVKPTVRQPRYTIALFAGCLQDFVYPEQLLSFLKLLTDQGIAVEFPKEQGCCGLPVHMLGEKEASREVARHNIAAIDPAQYDFIVTLCASCGSHLKENYPRLLESLPGSQAKATQFSQRIIDFSSFVHSVLGLDGLSFQAGGPKTAFHAPCHLCRGLDVTEPPRALLQQAGFDYQSHEEEETCCGLGGTYSVKFPELSAELLSRKLDLLEERGYQVLTTDCPGCIMQLRGGAEKQKRALRVQHTAEALCSRLLSGTP